jgi:hypothetical protein
MMDGFTARYAPCLEKTGISENGADCDRDAFESLLVSFSAARCDLKSLDVRYPAEGCGVAP